MPTTSPIVTIGQLIQRSAPLNTTFHGTIEITGAVTAYVQAGSNAGE